MKLIYTVGLPASGKTTWAKQYIADAGNPKTVRINKDDLRSMLHDNIFNGSREKVTVSSRNALITTALNAGFDVIVDDTNLNPVHQNYFESLKSDTVMVEKRDFTNIPLSECIKRDAKRTNPVGEHVIKKMHNQYLKPEVKPQDMGKPEVVLCDLDGTLALFSDRGPFDTAKCESDLVNYPIRRILQSIGVPVILMSGREDKFRPETERWLKAYGIEYHALYMRKAGDFRKDAIVKEELFKKHVQPIARVLFILDDRDQVVDMWRNLGLTCLQVNYGAF